MDVSHRRAFVRWNSVKMKVYLAVIFFTGLVITFASSAADDKYNILSSDGAYKPGILLKIEFFFLT